MELLTLAFTAINDQEFSVRVLPEGNISADCKLPFWDNGKNWLGTILETLHSDQFMETHFPDAGQREWMVSQKILAENHRSFRPDYLQEIGKALYNQLFADRTLFSAFNDSLKKAANNNTQLHLRLQFDANSQQRSRLADYPWELLHDDNGFLLHTRNIRLSRFIAFDAAFNAPLPVRGFQADREKLEMVLVSPRPIGLEGEDKVPKDQAFISQGWQPAASEIQLSSLKSDTFEALDDYFTGASKSSPAKILHFDGHGVFGTWCPQCRTVYSSFNLQTCPKGHENLPKAEGYLVFENEQKQPDYISTREFASLLNQTNVALVVLSACESAMAATGGSIFNGMAQNLVNHGVPAVVAMQYIVKAGAANRFAKRFYRLLGQKKSLVEAFNRASRVMGVRENQWYRPVLYLRWEDNDEGHLFAPQPPEDIKTEHQQVVQQPLARKTQPSADLPTEERFDVVPHQADRVKYVAPPKDDLVAFVGRENDLEKLHKTLSEARRVVITGRGGIGKTELARQYANPDDYDYHKDYPGGICWITVPLNPPQGDYSQVGTDLLNWVKEKYGERPTQKTSLGEKLTEYWEVLDAKSNRILLILDNVTTRKDFDQLQKYLPRIERNSFRVLVTVLSKRYFINPIKKRRLSALAEEAAITLLLSFIDEDSERDSRLQKEEEALKNICETLEYLPLGLELVGRYLAESPRTAAAEVLETLQKKGPKAEPLFGSKSDTPSHAMICAIELSYKKLAEDEPEAKFVGCYLSLFALDKIPGELIKNFRLPCNNNREDWNVVKGLEALEGYGLIDASEPTAPETYQLHRFIDSFFAEKLEQLPAEQKNDLKRQFFEVMLEEAKRLAVASTPGELEAVSPSIPHMIDATEKLAVWLKAENRSPELMNLFLSIGKFREMNGLYLEAQDWYEKCQLMTQDWSLEPGHPGVIKLLNALANVSRRLKQYEQAESLYKEAGLQGEHRLTLSELQRKEYVEIELNVAQSSDGLGCLYLDYKEQNGNDNRFDDKAKDFLETGLEIREDYLKEKSESINHFQLELDKALSLDNLARYYRLREEWGEAEAKYQEAFSIRQRLLEPKYPEGHPLLAESVHNLAVLHHDRAEFYQEQAGDLEADQAAYQTAIEQANQNYQKAIEYYEASLAQSQKLYGEKHFEIAITSRQLAQIYRDLKRNDRAEELYKKAQEITKLLLGNHLVVVEDLKNLANFYYLQERYSEAQEDCQKALEMVKNLSQDQRLAGNENLIAVRNTLERIEKLIQDFV